MRRLTAFAALLLHGRVTVRVVVLEKALEKPVTSPSPFKYPAVLSFSSFCRRRRALLRRPISPPPLALCLIALAVSLDTPLRFY